MDLTAQTRLARLGSHLAAPSATPAAGEGSAFGSQHTSAANVQNELQRLLEHDSWQARNRHGLQAVAACRCPACICIALRGMQRVSALRRPLPALLPPPAAARS